MLRGLGGLKGLGGCRVGQGAYLARHPCPSLSPHCCCCCCCCTSRCPCHHLAGLGRGPGPVQCHQKVELPPLLRATPLVQGATVLPCPLSSRGRGWSRSGTMGWSCCGYRGRKGGGNRRWCRRRHGYWDRGWYWEWVRDWGCYHWHYWCHSWNTSRGSNTSSPCPHCPPAFYT